MPTVHFDTVRKPKPRRAGRWFRGAVALTALAVLATGCAAGSVTGGPGQPQGSSSANLAQVRMGIFPGAAIGALYLGEKKGIFAEHGIDLTLQTGQGGAALLPAVASGDLDVAVGNPASVLTAAAKGLGVRIISSYASDGTDFANSANLIAYPKTGISSVLDLQGKKVAVNALQGPLELAVRKSVKLAGGDDKSIQFVELAYPDMPAQLAKGGVDAAVLIQPFLGQVLSDGGKIFADPQRLAGVDKSILVTFSSKNWIEKNPKLLASFRAALTDALDYAREHPQEVRDVLPAFMKMDPKIAKDLPFESVDARLDRSSMESFVNLLTEYGVLTAAQTKGLLDKVIEP